MKQLLAIVIIALSGIMVFATRSESAREYNQSRRNEALKALSLVQNFNKNPEYKIRPDYTTSESTLLANVDFSIADSTDYSIDIVVGLNARTNEVVYVAEKEDFGTARLPEGVYNFLFWATEEAEPYQYYILSEENIEIKDNTEFVVDFSKCTESVVFESALPDGSLAKTTLKNLDTDEVVEEGNIEYGAWTLYVFMKDILIDNAKGGLDRGVFDDGWSFNDKLYGDVKINPNQSIINLVQTRQMIGNERNKGIYFTIASSIPAKGGIVKNDPKDYAHVNNPFNSPSNISDPYNWPVLYSHVVYDNVVIDENSTINTNGLWSDTDDYWVMGNEEVERLGISFYQSPAKVLKEGNLFKNDNEDKLGFLSYPITNVNNEVQYVAIPNTLSLVSILSVNNMFKNVNDARSFWNVNPSFSYKQSQKKIGDGASTPILVSEQLWYTKEVSEQKNLRNVLFHTYKGRNGESISIGNLGENVVVKINGVSEDFSKYPSLHDFIKNKSAERFGDWDIEISNDNFNELEVKGSNVTNIHFNDMKNDVCAPTLQMLQTIDMDSNITDIFKSNEDGYLVLAGGDFNINYSEEINKEWYSIGNCDIKVEYSIHSKNEWNPLRSENVEDNFMMPGWGYYWKVSLKEIPTPSDNTLYDLRITLTDSTGNIQQQTLTPVFSILGSSKVDTVYAAEENCIYYNLQGTRISNLKPGHIYIEYSEKNHNSRKVLVK